ncbi:MAG: hypothetical protein UW02_C0008G0023 [Candidatus Nomurabacteria bacterium GW2011_GWB1_43_7]|uniref:Uncharacterized protein n=1 Tax=Candidatus Nomurabacteria bacterium GW2011_GWB1_43_7 TaxID=1618747 RepID=A0A0G1I8N0_9BACT|nr:MAG: hypothetical protein UW02_C0008G0023 [Candidatus Nomurabacteria bacterium GW2011_GWB1_43_7]
MEYKILLGYSAVAIEIFSYLIYFFGIFKGRTKPHAFTWFVWGVANIIAFAAIFIAGGGIGSWIFGVNAACCLIISAIGFRQKQVLYDLYDWFALFGSLLGILLWFLSKNPLCAVILISASDIISMTPTLRKAYKLPFEENMASFAVGIFYYCDN